MPVITDTMYLEINNIPLATPAWRVLDLSPLWDAAPVRGEDRLIPFAQGVKPLARVVDALRVQCPLLIKGDRDQDNAIISNTNIGLASNTDYLRSNIWTPNPAGDGTWPLVLHMPDSSTRGADCFVLPPMQLVPAGKIALRAVIDILIPAGELS